MADTIRVLHVDDDPDFVALTREQLEGMREAFSVVTASDASEGIERIKSEPIDCIISDYEMPGRNGIEFLGLVREDYPDLPFVLFTGKGSEEVASGAISRGVTDYLQKGTDPSQFTVLAHRVGNAVEQYRATEALERSQRRLTRFVEHSPLGVIEWNADFEFARVNEAAEKILGYPAEELLGSSWERIVPEGDREAVAQVVGNLLGDSGGYHFENRNVTADGEEIVCEWHNRVVTDDAGNVEATFSQFQNVTDRRTNERELRRQERRFEAVFHDPNILVGLLEVDGSVIDINDTAMEYVEADRDDVVAEPLWATPWFDHSADLRQDVRQWIDRAAAGEYVEFEADLVDTHGREYVIQGVFRPVTNEDGEVVSLIISDRDVTARKARARELEQTNAMLSTLFETLPVGVLAEDADRRVISANSRFLDLFGVDADPADVVGRACPTLLSDCRQTLEDPASFVESVEHLVTSDRTADRGEIEFADGRVVLRSYSRLDLPQGHGHLWLYRDVTERTRHQRTIKALHTVATDLAQCTSPDEVYDRAIEAARSLLAFDQAVIATAEDGYLRVRSMSENVPLDERPTMRVDEGIAGETFQSGEPIVIADAISNDRAVPQDADIRATISVPIGRHGVFQVVDEEVDAFDERDLERARLLVRHVESALDLLDRERELQRQTRRQESFANVVSHDLRNPLNVAAGRLDLLKEEYESEHLDGIERSHDRMYELIEDLLTLARSGKPITATESVALSVVARESWRNVETAGGTLEVETDVTIEADRARTKQLLENLFRNAIEHGGDEVTVWLRARQDGFAVVDDGPGIDPDARGQLFESGFSTGSTGTGFGLAIVADIASAHGWKITAREGTETGASFEVRGVDRVE